MIYLDTSVLLAHLLTEDRRPHPDLWRSPLVSSRLLQYEVWTRLHARGLSDTHGTAAQAILDRISFLELSPTILERAKEPFPVPVRTLDALHLASANFLHVQRAAISLASYDRRMCEAAPLLGIPLWAGLADETETHAGHSAIVTGRGI